MNLKGWGGVAPFPQASPAEAGVYKVAPSLQRQVDDMASRKGMRGFNIEVPHKRERNILVLKQAMGEAQQDRRMTPKIHKEPRNKHAWENEDWGEDLDQN